jgi:uncharacterized protein (DUF433 family)
MNRVEWLKHISVIPDLHHGDPCITGTRIPVATILGSLADGMTPGEIVEEYPQLGEQDIQAALAYAAEMIREEVFLPLAG